MFAPKNILVPTDFSDYSDKALKKAVDIASEHNSKIYLLHVIDEIMQCAADYCIDASVLAQIEKQSTAYAEKKLKEEAETSSASKDLQIVFDVKKGNTREMILNEQKDKGIDLIVIGSHGKKGLSRLGSIADKVLRDATCPVLVVK